MIGSREGHKKTSSKILLWDCIFCFHVTALVASNDHEQS